MSHADPASGSGESGRAASASALSRKLTLEDLDLEGRRVLVRVDLNVPVEDGEVTDRTRIRACLPTLRFLIDAGAGVIAMSHRGRPGGERHPELTMGPVAVALGEELGPTVELASDCVGEVAEAAAAALGSGEVLLLENLRFHAGETSDDDDFAAALARLGDLYVNDAFGTAHRAHASVVGVARHLPAAAGRLLQREVEALSRVLLEPASPFALVLGGAKVADKVGVIENLLPLVDRVLVGGAMANAFLAAQGRDMGGSLAPTEAVRQAGDVMERFDDEGVELFLPTDLVVASEPSAADRSRVVEGPVAEDEMALDIGPASRQVFARALEDARMIVWNGPMGVFERPPLAAGTRAVAAAIADRAGAAFTVLGGGDTAAAAAMAGVVERVSHVSTGGGASLDLLSGAVLPGIAALTDRADPS